MDQQNRIESSEVNLCIYGQSKIEVVRIYTMEKRQSGKSAQLCKRKKTEHSLTPYIKINSKWIKDLNMRLSTIKLLEGNIARIHFYINHSNIFFDLFPRKTQTKAKTNKWDLVKLKSFCTSKEWINKTKQPTNGSNVCK